MRHAIPSLLLLISVNSQSAPTCDYPDTELVTAESTQLELSEPTPESSLVAFSVEPSFTVLAEKSHFVSIAKEWGNRAPHQRDIHDLYSWIDEQPQSRLIDLQEFAADHSEKRRLLMMELAIGGKVYVRFENSQYVTNVTLQSWMCQFSGGEFAVHGGRRLVDGEGRTIIWTINWIA